MFKFQDEKSLVGKNLPRSDLQVGSDTSDTSILDCFISAVSFYLVKIAVVLYENDSYLTVYASFHEEFCRSLGACPYKLFCDHMFHVLICANTTHAFWF